MSSTPFVLQATELLGKHHVIKQQRVDGPADLVSQVWSLDNNTSILIQGVSRSTSSNPKYGRVELRDVSGDVLAKNLRDQVENLDRSKSLPMWKEESK